MDFARKCLAGFLILQALNVTPAWAANNDSEKPPGPPPGDGNFHMVRPLDLHAFSLEEAKKLIHDFSGSIDKTNKKAVLSGNISKECASHLAIKADADADENGLYSFSILDKDGQAVSCLEKHKDETCSTATLCVSLKELSQDEKLKKDFNIAIPVADKSLEKARVGLHSSDAVDVNGKTEASTECNCSVKPPGDQKKLEKLAADMGDIDGEKVRKKSHRKPKKEDIARDDDNGSDDGSDFSFKKRIGVPFQGINNQMMASGNMNMPMMGVGMNSMMGNNSMMPQMYGMNQMSQMNQMNQAMMMSYYQQMMMASMYQNSLGSMMYNQGYPYSNMSPYSGMGMGVGLNLNLTAGIR